MNTKVVGGAILAIIAALASGGFALSLDFSNTQSTDNSVVDSSVTDSSTTIINEGDTIINEIVEEVIDDYQDELIDYGYDIYCEEVNPDSPDCDAYWEEWD